MKFAILVLLSSSILATEDLSEKVEIIQPDKETELENVLEESSDNQDLDNKIDSSDNSSLPENQNLLDKKNETVVIPEPVVIPVGLNNLNNDEEGNWILKKLWWQEGQNVYNDILKTNDELLTLNLSFLVLKNDAERQFIKQWQSLNIDEKKLSAKVLEYQSIIKAEKEKKSESNENTTERVNNLEKALKDLDGLMKDFEDLFNTQIQLDNGFKQVVDNLKTCRNYETDSWRLLQKIGMTLDDQKAREQYLQISANFKNTKNLVNYLKNEYLQYMNKLVVSQNNLLNMIQDKLKSLRTMGYGFEKADIKINQASEDNQKNQLERQKLQEEKIKKANSKKSFIAKLYDKLNSWFSKIF